MFRLSQLLGSGQRTILVCCDRHTCCNENHNVSLTLTKLLFLPKHTYGLISFVSYIPELRAEPDKPEQTVSTGFSCYTDFKKANETIVSDVVDSMCVEIQSVEEKSLLGDIRLTISLNNKSLVRSSAELNPAISSNSNSGCFITHIY